MVNVEDAFSYLKNEVKSLFYIRAFKFKYRDKVNFANNVKGITDVVNFHLKNSVPSSNVQ